MNDSDGNINTDLDFSRGVYIDLIENGRKGIEEMSDLADEIGHPRAYEVLANMIKQTADVTDKLIDLHKKNKDLRSKSIKEEPKQIEGPSKTANVLAITSTDLQRMLLEDDEENVIEGEVNSNEQT